MVVWNSDRRGPSSVVRLPTVVVKERKFGSAGVSAVAAAAHCAGVIVWTPGVFRSKSLLAQKVARAAAGRNGLLTGITTTELKTPDGAMMVSTVFFENMPRV